MKTRQKSNRTGSLKKKAMICSTEAAAISIGIHVLLIVFAGSMVALKYVKKREVLLAGENINRPKLERRQLQMPVKVQELQKRNKRPTVKTRMATVSDSSFSLPDMSGLDDLKGEFDRGDFSGTRSLSSLGSAGGLGFGISGINFFGIRSKGEKVVFVVEASREMVEDKRGAYFTYRYAKDRLSEMIAGLRSATLFNVMFYTENQTVMFRPQLVPATSDNVKAVTAWYETVNDSPQVVGQLSDMPMAYTPTVEYDSAPRMDTKVWLTAVQAAMEQRADNIFILNSGWGTHVFSTETAERILGVSLDAQQEWLLSKGWTPERVAEAKRQSALVTAEAEKALALENEARRDKGLPPRIIPKRSMREYITKELKLKRPDMPPRYKRSVGGRTAYTVDEVVGHLEAVSDYNYKPRRLPKPKIHIVKLIASDGNAVDAPGGDKEARKLTNLKAIPRKFGGRFDLLRGAKTMESLTQYNPDVQPAP